MGGKEKSMRKLDGGDVGRTVRESRERYILVEEDIMGLVKNLALRKFQGIHKDDCN